MEIWSQATLDGLKSLNYVPHLCDTVWKCLTVRIKMSFILSHFLLFCVPIFVCLYHLLSSVRNKSKQKMYRNIIATEIINNGTFSFFSLSFWNQIFPSYFSQNRALSRLLFLFFLNIYLDKRKFDGMFWLVFFSSSIVPFYVKQISIKFTFQCHASTQRISERNKEQMSINTECVCVLCTLLCAPNKLLLLFVVLWFQSKVNIDAFPSNDA